MNRRELMLGTGAAAVAATLPLPALAANPCAEVMLNLCAEIEWPIWAGPCRLVSMMMPSRTVQQFQYAVGDLVQFNFDGNTEFHRIISMYTEPQRDMVEIQLAPDAGPGLIVGIDYDQEPA